MRSSGRRICRRSLASEVQVVQLLQNLLSNAVKYAARPDPVVEIPLLYWTGKSKCQ